MADVKLVKKQGHDNSVTVFINTSFLSLFLLSKFIYSLIKCTGTERPTHINKIIRTIVTIDRGELKIPIIQNNAVRENTITNNGIIIPVIFLFRSISNMTILKIIARNIDFPNSVLVVFS